jgi:hypothetical protein
VDVGLRTPLLEFFRRGEVARDIRLVAAQGALAPRPLEQLGLLVLLVADRDPDIARAAEETLRSIPPASLAAFLARAEVPVEMRAFFAQRGIEPAAVPAPSDTPLVDTAPEPDVAPADEDEQTTMQRIQAMNVAQRIALAMKGTREERAILIRDPNKVVGVAVLSSPKLSDAEVETIAKMTSVSDEILRIISMTRGWMKNYPVVVALAKNPKTPVGIAMNLLPRLNDKDLRMLSTDRNVAEILRTTARQKLVLGKER